jgi:DNA repair exonuclease SbcCD ATPase subunit
MDFVTRPEFKEHKNHMDSRFNTLEDNIKEVKQELTTTKLELKTDINNLRSEIKGDMNNLKSEIKGDMNNLRTELKTDIKDLKDDLISLFDEKEKANKEEMKHTQIKWYIATTLIIVGVVGRILGFY